MRPLLACGLRRAQDGRGPASNNAGSMAELPSRGAGRNQPGRRAVLYIQVKARKSKWPLNGLQMVLPFAGQRIAVWPSSRCAASTSRSATRNSCSLWAHPAAAGPIMVFSAFKPTMEIFAWIALTALNELYRRIDETGGPGQAQRLAEALTLRSAARAGTMCASSLMAATAAGSVRLPGPSAPPPWPAIRWQRRSCAGLSSNWRGLPTR